MPHRECAPCPLPRFRAGRLFSRDSPRLHGYGEILASAAHLCYRADIRIITSLFDKPVLDFFASSRSVRGICIAWNSCDVAVDPCGSAEPEEMACAFDHPQPELPAKRGQVLAALTLLGNQPRHFVNASAFCCLITPACTRAVPFKMGFAERSRNFEG